METTMELGGGAADTSETANAQSTGTAIVVAPSTGVAASGSGKARAFAFGEPEGGVLNGRRDLLAMLEVRQNGRWYEPPIPMRSLARTYNMSAHHRSAITYKRNQLLRYFRPSRWFTRGEFGKFVTEFLTMGNGYLERRDNLAGRPLQLLNTPAIHTRRGIEDGVYWWVPGITGETSFRADYVFHLMEHDLSQELYGVPEYVSALQSGLLNHDATIFRRKFYKNGSHMGYILFINDANLGDDDAEAIEEALERGKGAGNFKSMLLHIPGSSEKGVQILPIGEAAAKDEFLGIKNTTRDDVLAAHRVPPVLIGVVPQVTGGFGKPGEAADVFHQAEIEPLMLRTLEVNDWLGVEAVAYDPYRPMANSTGFERDTARPVS